MNPLLKPFALLLVSGLLLAGCKKEKNTTPPDNTPAICNCMANAVYQCGKPSIMRQYLLSGVAYSRTSYLDSGTVKYQDRYDTITDLPYNIIKQNDSLLRIEEFYGDDPLPFQKSGSDSLVCNFRYTSAFGHKNVTFFKEHPDSVVVDISYSSYFKTYTYLYSGRRVQ